MLKRFVIQYAVPRRGRYGTKPGQDWRIVESNCERRIRKIAVEVDQHVQSGHTGWQNGAGFEGGYCDRKTGLFVRILFRSERSRAIFRCAASS